MANTVLESGPAVRAVAVTPNDSTELGGVVALYIGTAGTLSVICADGSQCDFGAVAAGVLPLKVRRVRSTGTGASNIVALY